MPITVERIDFVSLPTDDIARSRSFYVETLGLPFDRDTPTGFEVTAGQVTLGVWDPSTGQELARMIHDELVSAVTFSPDGSLLATASWDNTARVWAL